LEFGSVGFYGRRKTLRARGEPTTNSTHMPTTGIKPGSQRWQASALTTTPALLPLHPFERWYLQHDVLFP